MTKKIPVILHSIEFENAENSIFQNFLGGMPPDPYRLAPSALVWYNPPLINMELKTVQPHQQADESAGSKVDLDQFAIPKYRAILFKTI